MPVEPFRVVARHVWRRGADAIAIEVLALIGSQFCGGVLSAIGQFGDGLRIEATLTPEHTKKNRTRRIRSHQECARRAPTQPVVHKPRNAGPITGTSKAMRKSPCLERVRGRTTLGLDRSKYFYGGGKPCGRRHGNASRIRTM